MSFKVTSVETLFPTPLVICEIEDAVRLNAALLAEISTRRSIEKSPSFGLLGFLFVLASSRRRFPTLVDRLALYNRPDSVSHSVARSAAFFGKSAGKMIVAAYGIVVQSLGPTLFLTSPIHFRRFLSIRR